MQIIKDGLKYYPGSKELWKSKGKVFVKLKEYHKAIESFQNAISFGDPSEINYRDVGVCYYWISKYDTASYYLTKAISINQKDPAAYFYLGTTFRELKEYDKAIDCLKTSAKLQQNDFLAEAFTQIAAVYYEQKNYSEALKFYQDAIRENPDKKEITFYLAVVYDHYYKDKTVALNYYKKYLEDVKGKDEKLVAFAQDRVNALIEKIHFSKADTLN